jgi:hypothetical protein
MPEQAAGRYGDGKFTGMMMAKVFCVHLLTQLDYNVLFQDVDVVWYRNPVEYFLREIDDDFDIYFQDDGAHSAPLCSIFSQYWVLLCPSDRSDAVFVQLFRQTGGCYPRVAITPGGADKSVERARLQPWIARQGFSS